MNPPDQDPDFLQYGDEAVERPISSVLDSSATADPMQKGGKKKKQVRTQGKTVILVAGGFDGYNSEAEEIEAIKSTKIDRWEPHSADFRATARFSTGESHPITTSAGFFEQLQGTQGKIARIVFIGHGNQSMLGLSGTRGEMGIQFTQWLDDSALDENQSTIVQSIQPKLDKNATIDIFACHVGVTPEFMKKIAVTFNRCVRGFSGPVFWQAPINDEGTKITNRGLVSSDNDHFVKGINHLRPTVIICP
jgi:hypothetical protein